MSVTTNYGAALFPRGVERVLHSARLCRGEYCVIHNPSVHHMQKWPINIRLDREYGLAERICDHGVGHPDPDSLSYIERMTERTDGDDIYGGFASDIHGCDGCCAPN